MFCFISQNLPAKTGNGLNEALEQESDTKEIFPKLSKPAAFRISDYLILSGFTTRCLIDFSDSPVLEE